MGLEPSHETYKVMACAYACAGNMNAVRETLERARAENIELKSQHLLNAATELVTHGHEAKLPEVRCFALLW